MGRDYHKRRGKGRGILKNNGKIKNGFGACVE